MKSKNPTPLQVNATGRLAGKGCRVAGRLVMGMVEAGQTYYWNEFYLKLNDGTDATLVYEESDGTSQWRLFEWFEPQCHITVEDAAAKRVGDKINLDGDDLLITLVDQSQVHYIEGEAPDGVTVGDVAEYFNAEGGGRMIVVSWTGAEVEYYTGHDVSELSVLTGFGLSPRQAGAFSNLISTSDRAPATRMASWIVTLAVLVPLILLASLVCSRHNNRSSAPVRHPLPKCSLAQGQHLNLEGRAFTVQKHTTWQIGRVGEFQSCHEFTLEDPEGKAALWYPLRGRTGWHLFRLLDWETSLSPSQAGSLSIGQTVLLDNQPAHIHELLRLEGQDLAAPSNAGQVWFAFLAESPTSTFLVRWNETTVHVLRGKRLDDKDLHQAFQP